MLMQKERELIVDYCLRMLKGGLTVGTSGNVSVRVGENIAITPSGVDYELTFRTSRAGYLGNYRCCVWAVGGGREAE